MNLRTASSSSDRSPSPSTLRKNEYLRACAWRRDSAESLRASGGPKVVDGVFADGGGNTFAFPPIVTDFEVVV